ncbi:hypothetical protein [Ahrensia sp. R2A130]|uniref:hypothetical protein n=1 Tax=Ahrensia sp. R2A130 TaxID=744979 RepID=UPI0001E0BCCB|nr:hypothetical protein [Ahrensia sp. R2A130]EFL88339.1 putative serine carboxypeptidase [Ahrensia sp. R2A130]
MKTPTIEDLKRIVVPAPKPMNWVDYFTDCISWKRKVKPLGKPCHDCAVECGFYAPYADELAKMEPDLIEAYLDTWFCHVHPDRGCAGARERVANLLSEASE